MESDFDPGEYDACTYCGRTIFPGVVQCPYCKEMNDGKGALGLEGEQKPRLPRSYVIAGWLLIAITIVPMLYALWYVFMRVK